MRPRRPRPAGSLARMRLARVLGAVGRTCITAGVLILLFVVYQLWGTGIREAQAQNRLEDDFAEVLEDAQRTTTTTTATTPPGEPPVTEPAPPIDPVPEGEPTAHIRIPAIGVDKIVVEGVALPDLKKGPGHYPETPAAGPGGQRRHRRAPHHLRRARSTGSTSCEKGDEILVETVQGEFRYLVDGAADRVADRRWRCSRTRATTGSPSAPATRSTARGERIIVVAKLAPDEVALPRPPRAEDAAPPEQPRRHRRRGRPGLAGHPPRRAVRR